MRLESDGLEALVLADPDGIDVLSVDWGWPVAREVTALRSAGHGVIDSTAFYGARTVTAALHLRDCPAAVRRRLQLFLDPGRRSFLYIRESPDDPELRVRVRGSSWSEQVGAQVFVAGRRSIVVQWVAPDGVLEAATESEVTVPATETTPAAGVTTPITTPLVFPDAVPVGTATVTNAGTTTAYPMIRVYGPCDDPVIENVTLDRKLAFVGLSIAAGTYVELDTRERTVFEASDPTATRYQLLDFEVSQWWALEPGDNLVRLIPAAPVVAPAQMVIAFRDAFLNP